MKLSSVSLLALLALSIPASGRAQSLPQQLSSKDALAQEVAGVEVDSLPGGFVVATPPRSLKADPEKDPNFMIELERTVTVYATSPKGGLYRIVSVHHAAEDRESAQRIARLAARLLRLHKERFGRDVQFPNGEEVGEIWLSRKPGVIPTAGGETRANHVYIYNTETERTPIEWVRTLAHEWGHLTLVGPRGFTAPEGDAAGYLGERLHLKWLREDVLTLPRNFDDFTERDGLNLYDKRQIAPLISRYNAAGPADKRLDKRDADGMDYYIAMVLAADDSFGSALCGEALFHTTTVQSRAFVDSLRNSVLLKKSVLVKLPAWVPFAQDAYTVKGTPGKIVVADRPAFDAASAKPFKIVLPGYKKIKALGTSPLSVTVTRQVAP